MFKCIFSTSDSNAKYFGSVKRNQLNSDTIKWHFKQEGICRHDGIQIVSRPLSGTKRKELIRDCAHQPPAKSYKGRLIHYENNVLEGDFTNVYNRHTYRQIKYEERKDPSFWVNRI